MKLLNTKDLLIPSPPKSLASYHSNMLCTLLLLGFGLLSLFRLLRLSSSNRFHFGKKKKKKSNHPSVPVLNSSSRKTLCSFTNWNVFFLWIRMTICALLLDFVIIAYACINTLLNFSSLSLSLCLPLSFCLSLSLLSLTLV